MGAESGLGSPLPPQNHFNYADREEPPRDKFRAEPAPEQWGDQQESQNLKTKIQLKNLESLSP